LTADEIEAMKKEEAAKEAEAGTGPSGQTTPTPVDSAESVKSAGSA
jgi:hypothetical protein